MYSYYKGSSALGASFYFSELGKLEKIGFKKLFQRYKAKGMFGTPLFEIVISAAIEWHTIICIHSVMVGSMHALKRHEHILLLYNN